MRCNFLYLLGGAIYSSNNREKSASFMKKGATGRKEWLFVNVALS